MKEVMLEGFTSVGIHVCRDSSLKGFIYGGIQIWRSSNLKGFQSGGIQIWRIQIWRGSKLMGFKSEWITIWKDRKLKKINPKLVSTPCRNGVRNMRVSIVLHHFLNRKQYAKILVENNTWVFKSNNLTCTFFKAYNREV